MNTEYDFVIIGSGFGGSVSALRLAEKGYRVLVLEKGRWFSQPRDFPTTNWNLPKWLWLPRLGLRGFFRIGIFRHVTVLSGVGVGGGSLVYANTLPEPKPDFYSSGEWGRLDDWETALKPFYALARQMLGATPHPYMSHSDRVIKSLAEELGLGQNFEKPDVAVYFGKPGETVSDPYLKGEGPDRTGCVLCGGCMLGCRYNAKNTLDKNYLYLAQKRGVEIRAEKNVFDVQPLDPAGETGYRIHFRNSLRWFSRPETTTARQVIFAGGVMGTLPLMLRLKKSSLSRLSDTLGKGVRTNSESLIGVTSFDRKASFSEGIAIGSMLSLDDRRHLEPVKYPPGAGIWRLFMAPMVQGHSFILRLWRMCADFFLHPLENLRTYLVNDWSRRTQILLYMESIDTTLELALSRFRFLQSRLSGGPPPTAFNPMAQSIARRVARIIGGKPMVMASESLLGIPTTAHILGGACMGKDRDSGVIDTRHRVFGYEGMWVIDGSAISANPGVNPSLTITAMAERAMHFIPERESGSFRNEGPPQTGP